MRIRPLVVSTLALCLAAFAFQDKSQTVAKPLSEKEKRRREEKLRKELETPYKKWLNEDVVYIITDEERQAQQEALQQMRHSKLWFAGRASNWELAGYELDELKEGFEDVAKLFPTVNDVSLPQVISAITAVQLPDLGMSISARDRARFAVAFDKMTATCNACHQSTRHAFIVIQRPTALPYTNQSFTSAPQAR